MVIRLELSGSIPIYIQLRDQIVAGISDGRLSPGERLPTVRALAAELGINAMTVQKTYQLMKQEGFLCIDRRSGARVTERFDGAAELPREGRMQLARLAAEAKARGMSRAAFLKQCELAFGEEERP